MSTPNERLRRARVRHFDSARAAARALGIPVGTYSGHENGHRGFPAKSAPLYARRFKVAEEWLLYGKGGEPTDQRLDDSTLAEMIEAALRELPAGTSLGEFPRLVAPALRAQLELYEADPESYRTSD